MTTTRELTLVDSRAMGWVANGEHGMSSAAMLAAVYEIRLSSYAWDGFRAHPADPDDLRRCLLFCDACGVSDAQLAESMAGVSGVWRELAVAWPRLRAAFRRECARKTGKAPHTYWLMQRLRRKGGEQ